MDSINFSGMRPCACPYFCTEKFVFFGFLRKNIALRKISVCCPLNCEWPYSFFVNCWR